MSRRLLATLGVAAFAPGVWAAEALTGEVQKQPLNVSAIIMFVLFVGATLCITYWASKRNKSAADYYAAGGKITGFQNGLAIAGDYMGTDHQGGAAVVRCDVHGRHGDEARQLRFQLAVCRSRQGSP